MSLAGHRRHVRTLVIDLDDTLIHSDWTRGRGWRTFKRPGAEDFLRQVPALSCQGPPDTKEQRLPVGDNDYCVQSPVQFIRDDFLLQHC
jgi:hypothetical protein